VLFHLQTHSTLYTDVVMCLAILNDVLVITPLDRSERRGWVEGERHVIYEWPLFRRVEAETGKVGRGT
jgi:hypothetical protein